ncbi:hypothetical protein D9613_011017 [Agrocybe pediades]|uniref:SUZ domain-containing protein n=1 Tax=Agrocybe pediades TaxID=84607 RepID=A0A8H4QLZ0_9AGAR|nr:hypothetical protein D9613_011017 [Agrocybe pediades]
MSRPATDTWGDEPGSTMSVKHIMSGSGSGTSTGRSFKPIKAPAVVDDWEMDNEDEDEEDAARPVTDVQNKRIWEDANSKEYRPMPSLVISRNSTSISVTPSLPLNQPPPMRILKRPSPGVSPSASTSTAPVGETFQEREARYQAARERIFGTSGDTTPPSDDNTTKKGSNKSKKAASPTNPQNPPSVKVVREPRGPASPNASGEYAPANKGFGERRGGMRPPGPSASTTDPASFSVPTTNIPA